MRHTVFPRNRQEKREPAEYGLLFRLITGKSKRKQNRDKILDFAKKLKKQTLEHVNDSEINCSWCAWCNHQSFRTGTGGLGNKCTSKEHPHLSIIMIGQNREKRSGDLRRFAIA